MKNKETLEAFRKKLINEGYYEFKDGKHHYMIGEWNHYKGDHKFLVFDFGSKYIFNVLVDKKGNFMTNYKDLSGQEKNKLKSFLNQIGLLNKYEVYNYL